MNSVKLQNTESTFRNQLSLHTNNEISEKETILEMQIRTTMRCHLMRVRMATIKKTR